jgi:MazG family protein
MLNKPQADAATDETLPPMQRLLAIMARLRDPDGGCPWDLEQTFATIAPHTIEEAYEVAEAIQNNDLEGLRDELGDLLFQVVFYAQMASESGDFTFEDVAEAICRKMISRHPHVFGGREIGSAEEQTVAWEEHKSRERASKAGNEGGKVSLLEGVSVALPGLTRAAKLGKRAARGGFDWPDAKPVFAKIREELEELEEALSEDQGHDRLTEETGDLLFAVANLSRHLGVDSEGALRHANAKFERRFRHMEDALERQGAALSEKLLSELEDLWNLAKKSELD